ncbi:hypothetical protein D3C72_1337600 [compost metagenome]
MAWPSTLRITSPAFRPAWSPGPPFSMFETSAPSGLSSLNESAKAWFTSCTATPRRACVALPVATIWSFTCTATSIGMANDTPW